MMTMMQHYHDLAQSSHVENAAYLLANHARTMAKSGGDALHSTRDFIHATVATKEQLMQENHQTRLMLKFVRNAALEPQDDAFDMLEAGVLPESVQEDVREYLERQSSGDEERRSNAVVGPKEEERHTRNIMIPKILDDQWAIVRNEIYHATKDFNDDNSSIRRQIFQRRRNEKLPTMDESFY